MRERGILFSAPMVRAILAGRKTQTRRAVKPIDGIDVQDGEVFYRGHGFGGPGSHDRFVPCPYGAPGDLLWVRETHSVPYGEVRPDGTRNVTYRAYDRSRITSSADNVGEDREGSARSVVRWTPAILMPRWASRITLAVESIRVERAQDISDADVAAEGVDAEAVEALWQGATRKRRGEAWHPNGAPAFDAMRPRDLWRAAWTLINGRASWDANPWVWVVSFRRTP